MIPILYEADEIQFTSNGIGRLLDCIRCEVTEERNGIYECEFEYPVNGAYYSDIKLGRIIAVEHDDTGDVQPFDIYKYSKPINGIVTFNAAHISYRQKGIVVLNPYLKNISNLDEAFSWIKNHTYPVNPFAYHTDFEALGYLTIADTKPHTVREYLGGTEGSILDFYGGEYKWNKFSVELLQNRGTDRNITVRYGVNMTEFTDDVDYSDTYNAVQPFWLKDTTIVYGNPAVLDINRFGGREYCVPLDLTDRFESQPLASELSYAGKEYMRQNQTYIPLQNIKVDFARLKDIENNNEFANLQKCELCDTVKVYFPMYDFDGTFKIVRVVWDVLAERYIEMELGNLSITLAEALGI